jgi:hypothetical protein
VLKRSLPSRGAAAVTILALTSSALPATAQQPAPATSPAAPPGAPPTAAPPPAAPPAPAPAGSAQPPPAGYGSPAYGGPYGQPGYGAPPYGQPGYGTVHQPSPEGSGPDLSQRYPEFPPGYAPRKIPADGGQPPPGYRMGSEPRTGLWVTGVGLLGGAYLASFLAAGTAVSEGEDDIAPLFIPVAGPWITVRTADDGDDLRVPLVMDGLIQLAGLGLLIGGLAAQRDVFVRSDVASSPPTEGPTVRRVAVGAGTVSMLGDF